MPNNESPKRITISYKGEVISDEPLMRDVWKFLMSDDCRNTMVLTTGSKCFDILAIVAAILKIIMLNKISNEDIIKSLKKNEMVLMKFPSGKQMRRVWIGIQTENGEKVIKTMEDINNKNASPSISTIPLRSFKGGTIKPYNGDSKDTGTKGIRQEETNREVFLAKLLDIPKEEVPAYVKVTLAVVTDSDEFKDIIDNTEIYFRGDERAKLSDLVPFSRINRNGDEIQYGKNVAKDRPVVLFMDRLSNARELMFDNREQEFGVLVLKEPYESEGISDLTSIMGANWVKFMNVIAQMESAFGEYLIRNEKDMKCYLCTKKKLTLFRNPVRNNVMVSSLYDEIRSAVNNEVVIKQIDGGVSEEEYNTIYTQIRGLDSQDARIEEFKKYALSLMKLFNTACFSLDMFEMLLKAGQIYTRTISPLDRISKMREIETLVMDERLKSITDEMEILNERLFKSNPKQDELLNILRQYGARKDILVVVPKAYYVDIMKQIIDVNEFPNVRFVTAGKYRPTMHCDVVIALSGLTEKRFDPLKCKIASEVVVLMYQNERKYYEAARKKNEAWMKRIELMSMSTNVPKEELDEIEKEEERAKKVMESFSSFDQMLNELEGKELTEGLERTTIGGEYDGDGYEAEIKYAGLFNTEEKILFTEYYTAVVFDEESGEVKEKSVEDLAPGDTMMFLKNDKHTQNIVDFIFLDLRMKNKLSEVVLDAYEKSQYWKKALKDYRERNKYSFPKLKKQFKEKGTELSAMTIMSWLASESRIVGPRKPETMEAIAQVTGDELILANPKSYYDACAVVRSERVKIRHLIEQAMKDKMSGNVPEANSLEEMIYKNIDDMVELMELNEIVKLDEPMSIKAYLANKPIRNK